MSSRVTGESMVEAECLRIPADGQAHDRGPASSALIILVADGSGWVLDGDVWIAVEPGDRLTLDRDQPVSLRADQSPLLVVLLQPQSIESAQTEPTSGESTAA